MIENPKDLNGAVIKRIISRTHEDAKGAYKGEWNAFELVIETDKGTLYYEGCHDCDPEIEMVLRFKMEEKNDRESTNT